MRRTTDGGTTGGVTTRAGTVRRAVTRLPSTTQLVTAAARNSDPDTARATRRPTWPPSQPATDTPAR